LGLRCGRVGVAVVVDVLFMLVLDGGAEGVLEDLG